MLTEREVVPYLLSRGLLSPKCVVEGDVAILDSSRRNQNFTVISPEGSYVLKQAVGAERMETVSHEASIYQALAALPASSEFAGYLPKCYGYDAEQHILILEFVAGSETLRERQDRSGRASVLAAERVAGALAALHRVTGLSFNGNREVPARRSPVLFLDRPEFKILRTGSSATLQLIKIIQRQKQLCDLLARFREEWFPSVFIHGDVRGDNFLIATRPAPGRHRPLKVVDFEVAGMGDVAWDVGSVFAEYLGYWLSSLLVLEGAPPDRFLPLAVCPLEKVQPGIQSFWRRYSSLGVEPSGSDELLLRSVKYCGVRLLNMAFEMTVHSSSISPMLLCIAQAGMNVLLEPERAAAELLGLRFGKGRAG
jgi:Ser/Thr protein kinase RdoA (MazF antagonist)